MNKKGGSVFGMFLIIFLIFFGIVFLGLGLLIFNSFDTMLDMDVDVGQANLAEVNNQTFGQMNDAFIATADTMGIFLIFGMVLALFINAYITGNRWPKLFFIIDIAILITCIIIAIYLSISYDILINSAEILSDVYIDKMPKTSTFVLQMPLYVSIIGAIIMILSYAGLKRIDRRSEVNVM